MSSSNTSAETKTPVAPAFVLPGAGGATDLFASMGRIGTREDTVRDMDDMPPPSREIEPAPADGGLEELSAKVTHRIFPKHFVGEDDFAVYAAEVDGRKEIKITYAGPYRPEKQEKVLAKGKWVMYQGKPSFKATLFMPEIPKGAEGAATWLKIAKIEGVGAVTVKKLVKAFGEKLPEAMESADVMATVVKRVLAERIEAAYGSAIGQPKLVTFLADFGLREALLQKIIKRFGAAAMKIVTENPWRLAENIDGIGFNLADRIGRKGGHSPDNPMRIKSGLRYALTTKTSRDGHCGLTREYLVAAAVEILGVDGSLIGPAIDEIVADRDAVHDEAVDLIYPAALHKAERSLADRILTLMAKGDTVAEDVAREAVEASISLLGVQRDESQVEAAMMAVMNPVSIITGGPGTGKSTTQRIIVNALEVLKKSVVLAAPTGRAAKRLSEVSGKEASTCHRLLSFSAEKGDFLFDRSNPFPQQRFIVDEFSMVDLRTASSFFDAIKDKAGITIVGDVDQLPSVGSGQVLRDMIESGRIPTTRLRTIHRQSGDSGIVVAAARINSGEQPIGKGEKLDGFYMKTSFGSFSDGEDDMVRDVVDFMVRRLPQSGGFNPVDDIQVLASMKDYGAGVHRLNVELKAALNPGTPETSVVFKPMGKETVYSIGDRVMHMRNDYVKKVYNGEVGVAVAVGTRTNDSGKDEPYLKVDYSGHMAFYGPEDASDIVMAWASTVHKSQGCEFPVVIFVCPIGHRRMLSRNLFYTAVTRAKKVCLVIGHGNAVDLAVKTENLDTRGTGLAKRLAA